MKNVGYYNGKMDVIEKMTIPMNDRVVYFGDGVYDATYALNRHMYEAERHIDRFYNSLRLLEIPFGMEKDALRAELQKCVDAIDTDGEVMVYWQATRGTGMRSHVFPEAGGENLLITVRPVPLVRLHTPMKLITMEDTRFLHCNIKTLNLIPSVIANQRAKEAGCAEAVFHRGERVTECAHSNVQILKNGVFITPPTDNLILPGITRRHLLDVCARLNIPAEIRPFTVAELLDADEIIVSSAGTLGIGACSVDGQSVGGKAQGLLRTIQHAMVDDFIRETGRNIDLV